MGIAILDAFDDAGPSPVSLTIAVDITADFVTAAALTHTSSAVSFTGVVDITADFSAVALLTHAAGNDANFTAAVNVTADFVVAASMTGGVLFEIPDPNSPRVAVVTHNN